MQKQIHINQQLMERDDRLVEIFDLERQINGVLGGAPYPLEAPPLPSRQKRKKTKRKAGAKKAAPKRVRKLDPNTETAYKITYHQNNETHTEHHFDPKPLALLLNTPLSNIRVQQLETIHQNEDGEFETVEILHTSAAE